LACRCEERAFRDEAISCWQDSPVSLEIASLKCARNDMGLEKTFLDSYMLDIVILLINGIHYDHS
jgi:hypothetical protein